MNPYIFFLLHESATELLGHVNYYSFLHLFVKFSSTKVLFTIIFYIALIIIIPMVFFFLIHFYPRFCHFALILYHPSSVKAVWSAYLPHWFCDAKLISTTCLLVHPSYLVITASSGSHQLFKIKVKSLGVTRLICRFGNWNNLMLVLIKIFHCYL